MKILNPTVFLDSNGELKCLTVEVPKEPKKFDYESGGDQPYWPAYVSPEYYDHLKVYSEALAQAKSSALRVKNREKTIEFIQGDKYFLGLDPENEKLYTLNGYEAEVQTRVYFKEENMFEKYATISPAVKEESHKCDYRKSECTNEGKMIEGVWVCSNHQVKEESQEEIESNSNALLLCKLLDLSDRCYHYLKHNVPSKQAMTFNEYESILEELTYYKQEYYNPNISTITRSVKEESQEVNELIYKVHEDMEGRYDLTGEDLYYIHAALCDLAQLKRQRII